MQESMLERDIEELSRDLVRAFEKVGAEHAFGDEKLVKISRELRERIHLLETTDACPACKGLGYVDHDCDCEHCTTTEVDCERCEMGRIPKPLI